MSFDAGKTLSSLDWTFAPFVDAAGVTPEPSQGQLDGFVAALQDFRGGLVDDSGKVDVERVRLAAEEAGGTTEYAARLKAGLLDAVAALCGGSPTREQLEELQQAAPRAYAAYLGYVIGTFLTPP